MTTYDTTRQESSDTNSSVSISDDGLILESDDVDAWKGPFPEYDKYGNPTGAEYYRCRDCSREVLEGINRDNVSHRDGCRFGDN